MMRLIAVDPAVPAAATLTEAAGVLARDGLVAFPTETFYGLAAHAMSPAAVKRIFEVKGRPDGKPVLVLVDSIAMVEVLAARVPPRARELMAAHWPGALTLVLPAREEVPAESGTIGVRLSAHPLARALVAALGAPITAPSANPSGAPPPTTAQAVRAYFDDRLELILDGGATPGGAPSTVLDVTVDPPRLLRAGAVRL
jgi:L-threonylcarbamoyladenylate synthase